MEIHSKDENIRKNDMTIFSILRKNTGTTDARKTKGLQ